MLANNSNMIELLVRCGANINRQDRKGRTALVHVISRGYPNIARYLVQQGSDLSLKNHAEEDVLMLALKNGSDEGLSLFSFLLQEKKEAIDVEYGNRLLAATMRYSNVGALALILSYNVPLEAQCIRSPGSSETKCNFCELGHGVCPLLLMTKEKYLSTYRTLYARIKNIDSIINCGHTSPMGGLTLLFRAIQVGAQDVADFLLQQEGIDPNQYVLGLPWEGSPLVEAIMRGNQQIVQKLMNHPEIDLNHTRSPNLSTPLLLAVQLKMNKIAHKLINHDSFDLNLFDALGNSGLIYATLKNNFKPVEALVNKNVNIGKKIIKKIQPSSMLLRMDLSKLPSI